jgi:hypothetical protein
MTSRSKPAEKPGEPEWEANAVKKLFPKEKQKQGNIAEIRANNRS